MGKDVKNELQIKVDTLFIQVEPFISSVKKDSNIVTVNGLNLPTNYLIDRNIILTEVIPPESTEPPTEPVTEPMFNEPGTYIILGNIQDPTNPSNCLITINYTFTEGSIDVLSDIDDDTLLKESMLNTISYLGTSTPSMLISTKIPTYNGYFSDMEGLCEEILFLTENYQNKDTLYNDYTIFVDFTNGIDINTLTTSILVEQFLNEIQNKINLINNIFSENEQYFRRLKTAMADLKVADLKTTGEENQTYYNSRTTGSQNRVDRLFNEFTDKGKSGYADQIQQELFLIKIPR